PINSISIRDRSLRIRRDTPTDAPTLARLYSDMAVHTNGNVDRIDFFWKRIRDYRGTPTQGYVFEGAAGVEGYLFLLKRLPPNTGSLLSYNTVFLTDMTAATPAAARCMLTFIADHYSLCDTVTWFGGCTDSVWQLLPRETFMQSSLRAHWMLRIVHCEAALAARGYSPFVSGEIHLDIRDDVLPGNNQRIVLAVRDGRGSVTTGGRGDLRIDVRGLAAMYAGFYTPPELRMAGLLDGDEKNAGLLSAACAGPASWMRDPF
ncbi:MAG: sterol carrier protein domain-containing protein, partial [Phycisphaerales bacterium]|nr:sterol carrier protein domain-containing protein [Phycisphaerales bacterium]